MKYQISTLLIVTALASLAMGLFIQFPGTTAVALACVPICLVFRFYRPKRGAGSELRLMAVLALSALPLYLTIGPALYPADS